MCEHCTRQWLPTQNQLNLLSFTINLVSKMQQDDQPLQKKRRVDHDDLLDVDCSQQKIETIEEYFLKNFTNDVKIRNLNASNNYIQTFDSKTLFDGNYLYKLNLSANNLIQIPRMKEFPNIVELCLNNNKIESISSEMKYCTKLQRLDLRFNRIKVIENLDNLSQLKRLVSHSYFFIRIYSLV